MEDRGAPLDGIGFGYRPRAPYASDPTASRGRLVPEPESATRTPFQRDRDRIIHSTAFRRLKHKTQVFVAHEGDHYRTRLTHTIEVAQIARAIARALKADEDLAEAVALVHDFGHPPFGHAGERALDRAMRPWGGFDHNAQSLAIVTRLERRYAEFDGLNLAWETLEGLVKHNGPLTARDGAALHPMPKDILEFDRMFPLDLWSFASVEAQAAAIADDIAYDAHDIDDGLRSGLLTLAMLEEVPLTADILRDIRGRYPGLDATRTAHELMRRQITAMVEDVIAASARSIDALSPASSADIRAAPSAVVGFSQEMAAREGLLKSFLRARLYRHETVMGIMKEAETVVTDLFAAYVQDFARMPEAWREGMAGADDATRARQVCDFLAGMTDTYALREYRRLFDRTPDLL
jgi:dGTPase